MNRRHLFGLLCAAPFAGALAKLIPPVSAPMTAIPPAAIPLSEIALGNSDVINLLLQSNAICEDLTWREGGGIAGAGLKVRLPPTSWWHPSKVSNV